MVLNSIFLYSYDGHTLAMRDYNPEESTVEVSKYFVEHYLQKALAKNAKLRSSIGAKANLTERNTELTSDKLLDGFPVVAISDTEYYAVYIIREEVVYTAFTKKETHILTVVEYLKVVLETLEESITGDLVDEIPKRPEIHYILDLLVDYSIPLLPNKNILKAFLRKEGIIAKSTSYISKRTEKSYQRILDKAIDECRTNDDALWHPHLKGLVSLAEECLIDHDEIVTGIIDKTESGSTVEISEVMGSVEVENKSANVHNIGFALRRLQKLESFSLHACAKKCRKRFEKDGVLNFTPGISRFTVAKYICNPFKFALPFEIKPTLQICLTSKTLKVKIKVKATEVAGEFLNVRSFCIKIHFPKYITGSSLCPTDEKTEFILNEEKNIGLWEIGFLKPEKEFELNGSFILPRSFTEEEEIDMILSTNFVINRYLISGSYIDSIKLRDNAHPIDVVTGTKATTTFKNLEMRVSAFYDN
ncbi:unnamed protein product [Moneuplotes crassus]|uniref:MHD domain-containing protein n=1 Tax=Euplotes crassus TaxID=5936 RepID=A0AAD1UG02_EUPCR|nr:unnamed protein product [Moneuplotes crassus]